MIFTRLSVSSRRKKRRAVASDEWLEKEAILDGGGMEFCPEVEAESEGERDHFYCRVGCTDSDCFQ